MKELSFLYFAIIKEPCIGFWFTPKRYSVSLLFFGFALDFNGKGIEFDNQFKESKK